MNYNRYLDSPEYKKVKVIAKLYTGLPTELKFGILGAMCEEMANDLKMSVEEFTGLLQKVGKDVDNEK